MLKRSLVKILLISPFLFLFLYLFLSYFLAPKVILVNQSGKDLQITSYYAQDKSNFLQAYGSINHIAKQEKYQKSLRKDKKLIYRLNSANIDSIFWINWQSSDQVVNQKIEISNNDFIQLKK